MNNKIDKLIIITFLILIIFLASCTNQETKVFEQIKTIEKEKQSQDNAAGIDEELEKEFNDNLEQALNELEEVGGI